MRMRCTLLPPPLLSRSDDCSCSDRGALCGFCPTIDRSFKNAVDAVPRVEGAVMSSMHADVPRCSAVPVRSRFPLSLAGVSRLSGVAAVIVQSPST